MKTKISEMPLLIKAYYEARDYQWPDVAHALMWATTEIGEATDVYLSTMGTPWVRNHPHTKKSGSKALEDELADAIMMLMVAGIQARVDPLRALVEKMERTVKAGA